MKNEVSAGGVIVRKWASGWQVLLIQDMNGTWTFPKGRIEPGETPKVAAIREIGEEVGLHHLYIIAELPSIIYTYKRNGVIHKTVHYYIVNYVGGDTIVCQKEEGISHAKWMSFSSALQLIGYRDTNVDLLNVTEKKVTDL